MKINEIYSTKEEVIAELKKRWADKELTKKLEDFLHKNIPEPFLNQPRAVLGRALVSPDNETKTFYEKSKDIGIKPIDFEYLDDIFITTNHGKMCLGKMVFYEGLDKNQRPITTNIHSIDLTGINEKKRFKDIKTLWGENFVDFHHRILKKMYDIDLFDGSEWYKKMGGKPELYYIPYIALFTIKHVLFEDLETGGKEEQFFNDIFFPAVEFIKKEFGLKPLIMPMNSLNDWDNIYWWSYPKEVKNMIK